jgi:hypothetical protein
VPRAVQVTELDFVVWIQKKLDNPNSTRHLFGSRPQPTAVAAVVAPAVRALSQPALSVWRRSLLCVLLRQHQHVPSYCWCSPGRQGPTEAIRASAFHPSALGLGVRCCGSLGRVLVPVVKQVQIFGVQFVSPSRHPPFRFDGLGPYACCPQVPISFIHVS